METLKIDRTKLLTQAAYAKKIGVTRARVNQMIKNREIKVVKIHGGTLIYLE